MVSIGLGIASLTIDLANGIMYVSNHVSKVKRLKKRRKELQQNIRTTEKLLEKLDISIDDKQYLNNRQPDDGGAVTDLRLNPAEEEEEEDDSDSQGQGQAQGRAQMSNSGDHDEVPVCREYITVENLQSCRSKIKDFLDRFAKMNKFAKVMKSASIEKKFNAFDEELRTAGAALNMELMVETVKVLRSLVQVLRGHVEDVNAVQQPNASKQTSENSEGTPSGESARTNATVENLDEDLNISESNARRVKEVLNTDEASEFSCAEDICEEDDCEAITDMTNHVDVNKKRLNSISKQSRVLNSEDEGYRPMRKKRKVGCNLYSGEHCEDIDSYCVTHGVACCCSCAVIHHNKLECVRKTIEVAIEENRAKLRGLKEKAIDKLQSCPDYGDQLRLCRQDSSKYLQALKDKVDMVIDEAMKTDEDREKEDAAKISHEINEKNYKLQEQIRKLNEQIQQNNEEIDEKNQNQELNDQIQKNNDEREKRLEQNQANADKRRQAMENKQCSLHADIQNIAEETERKIGELEKSWQDDMQTTEKNIQTLDTVLEDDQNVVRYGHHVITSLADKLDKPLDEGGVKHIARTISGVRFVQGTGREKYNGRIDGYDGEWRLIDTINVKDKITLPVIKGCTDECNVIITGDRGQTYMYMLDMNTKLTQRVITGSVMTCALLNDDRVVCGKSRVGCTGDSLTGCISVYDRQWKLINDVTIPRNTMGDETWVDVAVDQDGMIIAAEGGQSKIYVINPADGKVMNIISCDQNIMLRGVLSSGHIIAQPNPADHTVSIIDREGAQREITHSDKIWNVCIDRMTDDLYVVTSNDELKTCVIDHVMSWDDMKKRRIASVPLSTRNGSMMSKNIRHGHILVSKIMMTSSGNLLASDGDNILIYKKMVRV